MRPEIRRIVAADAHRRRTGRCPVLLHSMGNGESFRIVPFEGGLTDLASGVVANVHLDGIRLSGTADMIVLLEGDDVQLAGFDPQSGQRFLVRASGGVSATVFVDATRTHWQFAIDEED